MTNPTSNFGWQMPTSTDLVTDLPADFETFGQAVDTALADLKGGTSGQVLAKASNTDMDFSWVAQDDSNAIQNAIVDAKGDLIAASAADTPARLAVGSNNTILVVDSTTATGLDWKSSSALYNWTTYTPTNSGITLGNGNQVARYAKVGKIVFVAYRLVLGSTSSFSGGISVGLPSTANSTATCVAHIVDAGTNNYTGFGNVGGGESALLVRGNRTDGTYGTWSDNLSSMFTWTTNDQLMFSLVYEEA